MRSVRPVRDVRSRTLLRWRHYVATDGSLTGLRRFHTLHRLLVLAHDADAHRDLGAIVEAVPTTGLAATHARYGERLASALACPASRAQHLNVLEHAARGILDRLSVDERDALRATLRDYRRADVDLAVPQAHLRRMLRRVAPRSWAARQTYLQPCPATAAVG